MEEHSCELEAQGDVHSDHCFSHSHTSGDNKRDDAYEHSVIEDSSGSHGEKDEQLGVGQVRIRVSFLKRSTTEGQMRLFGDIMRQTALNKLFIKMYVEGKRRRGRPANSWI